VKRTKEGTKEENKAIGDGQPEGTRTSRDHLRVQARGV